MEFTLSDLLENNDKDCSDCKFFSKKNNCKVYKFLNKVRKPFKFTDLWEDECPVIVELKD